MNEYSMKIMLHTLVILKYVPMVQQDELRKWIEFCHNDHLNCTNCFDETSKYCCDTFLNNVRIENTLEMEVNSIFGHRQIQYGTYHQSKVVLKYLVSDVNLNDLKSRCCNGKIDCENIWKSKADGAMLKSELHGVFKSKESAAGFQICPTESVTRFMDVFSKQSIYAWVLLNINVEPLIVETLGNRNFSVPKLLTSCGFVTLQSNNGLPLYTFYAQSFDVRLLIAICLILPCNFHSALMVLDATPDNIVVDSISFDLTFVDLDSVFVVDSETIINKRIIYRHEKIGCEGNCFAYVPEDLCSHHLSDINLFAVCQLFVEDDNRMPDVGLLHSVPDAITRGHPELEKLVNLCINGNFDGGDRFVVAKLLSELFNKILYD